MSNLGRARTSTDEPEHESQNDMLRNTKPADEDTLAKESKEKLVGSSSSEKANKKGIVEEILENTIDMHSASGTVTTDETSLEETEPEIKLKDTPDADSTEAAATAETNSTNGDGTSISLKSETNMKHSSTPPTEENEVMILDSSKKIDEISSNDHIPSENPNTPRTTQTKEEKLQKEDDSTIPINISKVGSTEIESESVVEKNVDEGACMFSKLRTDKTITESENDEHFERENIADEWEVESHAHESEPFDTKHEKTPREEFRSCSLANNSMTSKKTEIQAPDSDNSTLAETSHAKMYNEVNEKSYLGLDKQKTDELSIPNDKDNSIEDDKQQTKDEV